MSLINITCLCIFLVFGHLSESRVLILRDYDDEPFVLAHGGRLINEETEPKVEAISISSRYRPKKMRSSKKTILQYGRHIYQFDDFEDLNELRSEISELKKPLKDSHVSYDYLGLNDWKSIDSAKDGNLIILSGAPLAYCNGEDCEEERKVLRKYDDHKDWKHDKNRLKFSKRYQIVDRYEPTKEPKRTKYDSSENNQKMKKTSAKNKKKKKKHNESTDSGERSSESMDSEDRSSESRDSEDRSSESRDSKERSSESSESEKKKKYSSEERREIIKKPNKKYVSTKDWTHESNSIENIPKKKKKNNYESSDKTKRKTIAVEGDYFMQGNKIFHSYTRQKKKRHEADRRKRLEHFLPKRYHWEPEEIHELGYFWFNGPKGLYPAPKPL